MRKLATLTAAAALVLGLGAGQAVAQTDRFVDNDGLVKIATLDCGGVVDSAVGVTGSGGAGSDPFQVFTTIQGAIDNGRQVDVVTLGGADADNGDQFTVKIDALTTAVFTAAGAQTLAAIATGLANALNGDAAVAAVVTADASAVDGTLTLKAVVPGAPFVTVVAEPVDAGAGNTTIGVDTGGAGDSIVAGDCNALGGIACTVAGDSIIVCPGEYVENVNVHIRLELIGLKGTPDQSCFASKRTGDEPTQPCVFADGSGSAITISAPSGPDPNVELSGFKATNSGGAPAAGIRVLSVSDDNIVRSNTALDNGNHGILIESDGNTVDSNNAHDNLADGFHVVGMSNTFTDNKAHDNGGDGFEFEVSGNTVDGNRSNKNDECGFNGDADYNTTGTKEGRNRANNNDDGNFCPTGIATTGEIKGRVTDSNTAKNLRGVLVTPTGTALPDTTRSNGRYTIDDVPVASVTVTATKTNCTVDSDTVMVKAGESVTANLQIACP